MMKLVVSVAASSLRKALENDREGLQNIIEVLKQYVQSNFCVNLRQDSSNQRKTVPKIHANYSDEPAIIWHYVINKNIRLIFALSHPPTTTPKINEKGITQSCFPVSYF